MGAKPWPRILACGFICGIVWALLGAVLVGIVGGEFLSAASRGHPGALTPQDHALMFGLTVAAGLWAMWLYSFMRQSIGSGLKSVIAVGLAWWVIAGLQSAKWMTLGGVPGHAAVPLAIAILPAMIVATFVGAWFYEREGPKR